MESERTVAAVFRPGSVHMVGDGFHVRNLFPSNALGARISPFLLLDYAGPTRVAPADAPRGVGEHPHRGFETVTVVYQGAVAHRDSAGNAGVLGPGDVQWMTAGAGVVHEELHERDFARAGGTLQMVQLWVNLPARHKLTAPKYQELARERIPELALENGAGSLRVIAGQCRGVAGPAATFTPLNLWDLRLNAGGAVELEVPSGHNAAAVVLEGQVQVGPEHTLGEAELALFAPSGTHLRLAALAAAKLLLLSGEPIDEPVVAHGPFVMNSGEEIYRAIQDYRTGRMGRLHPRDEPAR